MTCAVIGIGRTTYSKNSGRTTRGMAVAACRDAIENAGLTPADVDGICTFMANDSEQPIFVGWALGIEELAWANAMFGGGNLVADQIASRVGAIVLTRRVISAVSSSISTVNSLKCSTSRSASRRTMVLPG